jgi:transcriptional regulator with XRE-family HTH domain
MKRLNLLPLSPETELLLSEPGLVLRLLRKRVGLAQHEVASYLGITQCTYGKYEARQVRIAISTYFKALKWLESMLTEDTFQIQQVIGWRDSANFDKPTSL